MNQKWTLVLALAAGFVGSALFHGLSLVSVHAQVPSASPKELRARSFVLVDDSDTVLGRFAVGNPSIGIGGRVRPKFGYIQLFDSSGNEIWTSGFMAPRPVSR
jgi:hypothetical protein